MATYKNFYETVKEANMRLRGTVVLYDGFPYTVLAIANHKKDGIFRIYLDPLSDRMDSLNIVGIPHGGYPTDHPDLGKAMDAWIEANPSTKIIRKNMDSPLFNKYRPFPLGMYASHDGRCVYLERCPTRKSEQGLTHNMIRGHAISLSDKASNGGASFDMMSTAFADCILGKYPSFSETAEKLASDEYENTGVGFHRMFCLVKGPVSTMFLGYKTNVIGVLVNGDASVLKIAKKFEYTREAVEELGIFQEIYIK